MPLRGAVMVGVQGPASLSAGVSTSVVLLAALATSTSTTVYLVAVKALAMAMVAVRASLPAAWLMAGLAGVPACS